MTSEKAPELKYPEHLLVDIEAMTLMQRAAREEELIAWVYRFSQAGANPKWAVPHLFELARLCELRADVSDALVAAAYEAANGVVVQFEGSWHDEEGDAAPEIMALIRALTPEDARAALDERERQVWNAAIEAAMDEVHQECWTDGAGGAATETLMAEQATTSLALRTIAALKKETQG